MEKNNDAAEIILQTKRINRAMFTCLLRLMTLGTMQAPGVFCYAGSPGQRIKPAWKKEFPTPALSRVHTTQQDKENVA